MKKLKELEPSENRIWYNEWVSKINGEVLDIGKSKFWDYSDTPYYYKSLDIDEKLCPDIVADICDNTLCSNCFDYILCNGMFECVNDPQKMVDEVYRILKPKGTAIFGFVGKDYKPYKKDWKFYDNNIDFKNFEILEKKDFDKNYHFIIVKK
jgi:SAM-dependent methyltransferase